MPTRTAGVRKRLKAVAPRNGSHYAAPRAYAAERWARAVAAVVDSPDDPRTLEAWGRMAAAGRGTLRSWCRAAQIPAKASLAFARLLRAIVQSQGASWDPQNTLDIVDQRTLKRLFDRGGLPDGDARTLPPSCEHFLSRQRLVSHAAALRAVAALVPAARSPK